jgi:hypothetical protein
MVRTTYDFTMSVKTLFSKFAYSVQDYQPKFITMFKTWIEINKLPYERKNKPTVGYIWEYNIHPPFTGSLGRRIGVGGKGP